MISVHPHDTHDTEVEPDPISRDCRDAAERALHGFIRDGAKDGWRPAELAMALADAAEDYIMMLARRQASRH